MKQFSMYIPDDLHLSFKLETAKESKSMGEVVRELVSNYVQEFKERKPPDGCLLSLNSVS